MRTATTRVAAAAAPPQFSRDGAWFWDGGSWISTITSDGRWRWDGYSWRPMVAHRRGEPLSVPLLLGIAALDLVGLFAGVTFFMSAAAAVVVLAVDGRRLVTLDGLIKWRRLSIGQKLLVAAGEILLFQGLLLVYVAQRLYSALTQQFRFRSAHRATATPIEHEPAAEYDDHVAAAPAALDTDELQRRLTALVHGARGQLTRDLLDKVQALSDAVFDILPAHRAEALDPHDQFFVERTVDDYLPAALRSYLNLPAAYRSVPLPEAGGKTASQVLSDQLDLLLQRMHQVVDATYKKDLQALLVHGRFLDSKFGRSSLTIGS